MPVLAVDSKGCVTQEALDTYIRIRREEVGRRLQASFESSPVARDWYDALVESELHDEGGDAKYLGDASAEGDTKAALERAKAAEDPIEIVNAVEDLIMSFCGFNVMKPLKAKCIINAVHFQFNVDVDRLLGASLSLPSADGAPTDAEKALFDEADIGLAELLLRVVVETSDGCLLANPFSPGMPMGKLLKLPIFAQFVMVLTNAVEATWYQEAIPSCPMAINLYASLLVAEAPVQQMTAGVSVVEVMEMTKGAKRGPEVDDWVGKMREAGAIVSAGDVLQGPSVSASTPTTIPAERRVLFAHDYLERFGYSPYCEKCCAICEGGCSQQTIGHSESCQKRTVELMMPELEEQVHYDVWEAPQYQLEQAKTAPGAASSYGSLDMSWREDLTSSSSLCSDESTASGRQHSQCNSDEGPVGSQDCPRDHTKTVREGDPIVWSIDLAQLDSKKTRLSKKFDGRFLVAIHAQEGQHGKGDSSFRVSGGKARVYVKCLSESGDEGQRTVTVSLSNGFCSSVTHNFSVTPQCKLPELFDFKGATDPAKNVVEVEFFVV